MSSKAQGGAKKHLGRKPDSMDIVFILLGILIVLFLILPLLKTLISSSPETFWSTLLNSEVYYSILLTIYTALVATLIGLFLGVPLAYLLARRQFRGKGFLEGLIDIPIVIPHSAAGVALLLVFGRQFFFGRLFNQIGISFVGSIAGVVIAMMFVSVPYLIDSAREGFKAIDPRLEKVSRTLGASPWQSFFKISLPLAWRSIFSGSVMMWARGMSEFGAVYILAYYAYDPISRKYIMPSSVLVSERFNIGLDYAQPITALVIMISLVIFIVAPSCSL